MSADYFDRLEAELRGAVPHANAWRARHWPRWRWRPQLGGIAVAVSAAVTLAMVLLAVGLHGHRPSALQKSLSNRGGSGSAGASQYALGALPTLPQLLDNFAVLRRPQTPQDLGLPNGAGLGPAVKRLTRLARTLPGGYRVYLQVDQPWVLAAPRHLKPGRSYALNMAIVNRSGNGSRISFLPSVQYNVYPLPSMGNDPVWASMVPDGVAKVLWTFACPGPVRLLQVCKGVHPETRTVPVIDNVAAARIPIPGHTPGHPCGLCARPSVVTWISPQNQVVARFGLGYNLPAPPFVLGGRGDRVLRVLQANGLAGSRLGDPWGAASASLESVLGRPADTNVVARGCGIDHESVWTSPAVADPLTIFERQGRFVGYQYGAPVSEIGLEQGPGAVLATTRGLTIAQTVAVARRLYGKDFLTSTAGGGTWRARADGGTVRGAVLQLVYPLRAVTGKNPVATIQAGMTGCLG